MLGRRGYLLVWAIFYIAFVTTWMSTSLRRGITEHDAALLYVDSDQAFHLAEAGLDQEIENLRTVSGADDVYSAAMPTGSFTIDQPLTVIDVLLYEVHAHGNAGAVVRSIVGVLQVTPLSIFRHALFGDEGVVVSGSAEIDSYDSRNGPYDPVANSNNNGNVGTNGTDYGDMDLNGTSLFIDGQLSVGPGVDPPESIVEGFDPALISADPPVISNPEFPLPEVKIPGGVPCSDLKLTGSTVWTLNSPGIYCFDNLEVKAGAELTSNGPVTVYLTESLSFEGNSTIGVVNDPTQFLFLMASGSNVTIAGAITGTADMYAAMYGPDASILIAGDAQIYGSIVGNEVNMAGSSQLHYDEALADIDILANEGEVELLSWREDE